MCEWWDSRAYIGLIRKGPLQKFYSLTSIFNTSVFCTYKKKSSGRWLTLYRVKKSNIFLDSVSYRVSQQAEKLKRHKMDKGWSDEHELITMTADGSICYLSAISKIYKTFTPKFSKLTPIYLSIYLFIHLFICIGSMHAIMLKMVWNLLNSMILSVTTLFTDEWLMLRNL